MALCSQAFSPVCKRACEYNQSSLRDSSSSKRACLSKIDVNTVANKHLPQFCSNKIVRGACFSSSDSNSESEDSQLSYVADQVKAKRRASHRVSFNLSNQLSRAVAQYSDDDDELKYPTHSRSPSCSADDINLDCRLSSSPLNSSVFVNNFNGNIQMLHRPASFGGFFQISDSSASVNSINKTIPDSDRHSRSRCFEYLVGAIDEAWARYCDVTSSIENRAYGYNSSFALATDDEDDCGATTDLTDYETDIDQHQIFKPIIQRKFSILSSSSAQYGSAGSTSTSGDPSSCQLQALKDRLTKAKYFLQDLVDSEDHHDAHAFWKRWDMIKYATIELVEDDDDDDVVENTIDELEEGRLFASC